MELTYAQKLTLKAAIIADPQLNAFQMNSDGAFAIADLLNLAAVPAYIVWRSEVTMSEIMSNGFRWVDVDGLTAQKYRTWEMMVMLGTINPSRINVRQGIKDCWGNASLQELAILPHLKRSATRAEKILATGTGTDAAPSNMGAEGKLTYQEIEEVRGTV